MFRRALLALFALALFTAPAAFAQTALPADITGRTWELTSLTPAGGAAEDVTGGGITLEFREGNTAGGSGGCNTYRTSYTASGSDGLTFTPAASTLIACEGVTGTRETAFLQSLEGVRTFSLANDQLTLSGENGLELVFAAAAATGGATGGTATTPPASLPTTSGDDHSALWLALALAAAGLLGAGLSLRRSTAR